MADLSTDSSKKASSTPYQLDLSQTTKACKVLQQHIENARKQRQVKSEKRDLLEQDGEADAKDLEGSALNDIPLWMIVTGKKHIADRKRLKPSTIKLPHPLNKSSDASICLITADPQRLYKDIIAAPGFPSALRSRITRVIGLEKMTARYKSFESKRQLALDHDVFLADSRVWTYLPKILGKVFFQGGTKRPIPVEIGGSRQQKLRPGQTRKSTKGTDGNGAAWPGVIAKEIEKAVGSAAVHLSTSNTTAIKVATAGMTPSQSTANVAAVVEGMTSNLLPQGWRNVRSIHIKGPNTPALPIWLASELWTGTNDVVEEAPEAGKKRKRESVTQKAKAEPGTDKHARRRVSGFSDDAGGVGASDDLASDKKNLFSRRKGRNANDAVRAQLSTKLKGEVIADAGSS